MDTLSLELEDINVNFAKEYIIDEDSLFNKWPPENECWTIHPYDYEEEKPEIIKKKCTDMTEVFKQQNTEEFEDDFNKYWELAKKIEQHTELFAQLDYLLRKTNPDDVRNGHIKLLTQYIRLQEPSYEKYFQLIIEDDTPLYYLGYIGNRHLKNKMDIITTSHKLAPICFLFHELCCEVGLNISLHFVNIPDAPKNLNTIPFELYECDWVITERSDMCSAVDNLMLSSKTAPWRVNRVWIQESVYSEVRELVRAEGGALRVEGLQGEGEGGYTTHVYRTSRELLALLGAAPLLSVWSSDHNEAIELAHGAAARLVWINCYADFSGPSRVALPLYARCRPHSIRPHLQWKRTVRQHSRRDAHDTLGVLIRLGLIIRSTRHDEDAVAVERNSLTYVHDEPSERLTYTEAELVEVTGHVLAGQSFILDGDVNIDSVSEIEKLNEAGIPVFLADEGKNEEKEGIVVMQKIHLGNYKVVKSTYGTIFAN